MEISIIKDNSVKYTRYYIFSKPDDFRIDSDCPLFFEGNDKERPLQEAKRYLKSKGCTILKVWGTLRKWKEYIL